MIMNVDNRPKVVGQHSKTVVLEIQLDLRGSMMASGHEKRIGGKRRRGERTGSPHTSAIRFESDDGRALSMLYCRNSSSQWWSMPISTGSSVRRLFERFTLVALSRVADIWANHDEQWVAIQHTLDGHKDILLYERSRHSRRCSAAVAI
jgi:hypothetical protein